MFDAAPHSSTGAVSQRWRDKHGRVEVKVASNDRKHAEAIRLLDSVYMKEVFHRYTTPAKARAHSCNIPTRGFSSG